MGDATRRILRAARALFGPSQCVTGDDNGFTVIEVVMASAILLTVLTAVMATVSYAATGSMQAQQRQGALDLATFRIEQAHSLPYASVGTTMGASLTGSPAGSIPAVETSGTYTISTTVRYAIDPTTHLQSYKIVHVDVTWTTPMPGIVSVESAVIGGEKLTGAQVLLSVVDLDDATIAVPGTLIVLSPSATTTKQQVTSDNTGMALFASVPTGTIGVAATKAGYLADLKPFTGKIVNTGLNQWTLSMQQASSATLHVQLADGTPISGCSVSLTCTDTSHAAAFSTSRTTDVNGDYRYSGLWEIKNVGYSYLAKFLVPGDVNGSLITTTFPMGSGGLNPVVTYVVPATNWIRVNVYNEVSSGSAFGGATVSYTLPDGSSGTRTALSDIAGHAYFFNLTPGVKYTFTANYTYGTAPYLRTGSASRTIQVGANTVDIYTVRQ